MPQLGETVTEGTIIRWLKQVGDSVAIDEPLFEVSTDKVDSEVPSPAAGVLTSILVEEGETVDVGARLAVVGEADSAPASSPAPEAAPAPSPEPPVVEAPPPPPPPPAPAPVVAEAPPPPPAPEPVVAEVPPPAPAPEPVVAGVAAPTNGSGNGARGALLSPVVRRLIAENQLDTSQIKGTGMGGRITRDDVQRFIDERAGASSVAVAAPAATTAPVVATAPVAAPSPVVAAAPVVAPAPAPSAPVVAPPAAPSVSTTARAQDEVIPFSTIRRVTAEHMVRSKATSAHALVVTEADFENVERVRRSQREMFREGEGFALTYLPFIARATVDVLRDYPHLNASVGENALVVHHEIHLGIAVDLANEGLIVPVIHNADGQSLRGIARSISDLAGRARSKRLGADDIAGGTFTITNPGPYGTFLTYPIIAQPQIAILSTDGIRRKPVVVDYPDGTEAIAIHSVGMIGLAFDHRAVDGAYAAAFVRDVAKVIETRDWAAEL